MEDIRAALQNPQLFSSTAVVPTDPNPPYSWIPEMLDPPVHTTWRQLLGPTFSPSAIAKLEPRVRQRFSEILDRVAGQGECDYVADVALLFPNTIFMEIMGLPVADAAQFQSWETDILHTGATGNEISLRAMGEVIEYFSALIAERRKETRQDLVSVALDYRIDGQPASDEDLLALCLLLFMAGLDTVAMQLSYSMLHLATHEEDRKRLVADPSLFPSAIEEFLRYYSFVTPGRKVVQDSDFHGCPVHRGQMTYLPLVSANRDPNEFEEAHQVRIDRSDNRHIAFGAGPHRCLGSHLARQELRIGLTEWHAAHPQLPAGGRCRNQRTRWSDWPRQPAASLGPAIFLSAHRPERCCSPVSPGEFRVAGGHESRSPSELALIGSRRKCFPSVCICPW